MRLSLSVGVGLLLWQAAVAALTLSGAADLLLTHWSGPTWLVALCGVLISPPIWLGWMIAAMGLVLIGAALIMSGPRD